MGVPLSNTPPKQRVDTSPLAAQGKDLRCFSDSISLNLCPSLTNDCDHANVTNLRQIV